MPSVSDETTFRARTSSVLLGLPFPLLFAIYAVYLDAVRPEDGNLRGLAGIQIAFFAVSATAIVGFLGFIWKDGIRTVRKQFHRDLWDILWLNVFTALGPPLYFIAVVLLGAAPANWIDLGMTPLLTMAAGLWSVSASERRNWMVWAGTGSATLGLSIVVVEVASEVQVTEIAGVVFACLSAIGTAGAVVFLKKIQKHENAISSAALLSIRFILPTLLLAAVWAIAGWRLETGAIVVVATPGWFIVALLGLYVLPNYLYVVVVKKKGLLFSGFMWAMLPVFGSVAELVAFGPTGMSLNPWTTVFAGLLILGGTVVCDIGIANASYQGSAPLTDAPPSVATALEQ